MSPRARQAKGKARLQAYEELLAQDMEKRQETAEIVIPPGPRLGDVVVRAKDVKKGFGDRLLFEGMTFSLPRGGIVGVIGPNGAGKTTLFRMIVGRRRSPTAGARRSARRSRSPMSIRSRDALDPERARSGRRSPTGRRRSCSASAR